MSKRVLLAVGESNLTAIFRKHLRPPTFDVSDNEVLHRNYIPEFLELDRPDIILLHDYYLPSDAVTEKDKDDEILKLIEDWRLRYNDSLRVVFMCERDKADPFLGALVARNVLDIFNERQFSAQRFIEQLSQPPQYTNVKRLSVGTIEIELDEEPAVEDKADELVSADSKEQAPVERLKKTKEILSKYSKNNPIKDVLDKSKGKSKELLEKRKESSQNRNSKENSGDKESPPVIDKEVLDLDDVIDFLPVSKETFIQKQILGTVFIAIGGTAPHIGSTHTALSMAAFLSKNKFKVAVVEANDSKDFDRIHSLYEGEKTLLSHEPFFELNGIEHYKYREDIRFGEIASRYEYVVLDAGYLEESPCIDEFMRAHVKCVLTSPYEWKEHWLTNFLNQVEERNDFVYVLPFGEMANQKDMEERFSDLIFVTYPVVTDPYTVTADSEDASRALLLGYLQEPKQLFTKNSLILTSVGSIAVTVLVFAAYIFL